ncbi:MAG: hypothetical protein AAGE65_09070 [Planctomycetota bacterium]
MTTVRCSIFRVVRLVLIGLSCGLGWIAAGGCSSVGNAGAPTYAWAPPDFALQAAVYPDAATPRDRPHLRSAQHVVEADGTFRAAVGPGIHAGMLPPVTARLDPSELDRLWRLAAPLMPLQSAEAAAAESPGAGLVELGITAGGQTQRGFANARRAEPLLRRLARLRGDRP